MSRTFGILLLEHSQNRMLAPFSLRCVLVTRASLSRSKVDTPCRFISPEKDWIR